MSRHEIMDTQFQRHDCAQCDKCQALWVLEVCRSRGWVLGDRHGNDLCERCKPQRKSPRTPAVSGTREKTASNKRTR